MSLLKMAKPAILSIRQTSCQESFLGAGKHFILEGSYEVRIDAPAATELLSANAKLDVVAYANLSVDVDKNQDALARLVEHASAMP